VRVWLVLALAGALLVFGSLSFIRRADSVEPTVGADWVQSSLGPLALSVRSESPAWYAGLREGDLLLEIDGQPVASALEAAEIGWRSTADGPLLLKVRRGSAEVTLRFMPAWQPRTEPYAYLAVVGLAFWVSGVFIALRWPMIRGSAVYTLLALCLFANLTLSHTGRGDQLDWAIYWFDLAAAALAPALLLHLGVALSKRTLRRPQLLVGVAYSVSLVFLLTAVWLSPGGLGGAYRFADPLMAVEGRDRVEPMLLALALVLTATLLAKSYRRSSSVLHRSQMRWLLWGLAAGFGPFVMLDALPWSLGAPELPTWARLVSVVPMLFVPATFTAALARYRPHDLDLIVLRGFSEVTSLFCASGVYAVTVVLFREGLEDLLPLSRSATRYFGLLATAVSYPSLRAWVRAGVDRAFYRKRYSYRATLLDWARELNAETDLPSLLHHLRVRVCQTLGVPKAEVLVLTAPRHFAAVSAESETEPLELGESAINQLTGEGVLSLDERALFAIPWARYLFAMKVKGRLRAVLAIAEREAPEEPLTSEDRAMIATLSAHAATAIEAARLVLEVRQRAAEIERLHARQAKILESSAVGLLLLDGEGKIQAWNRALEAIYGLDREQALGRRLSDAFPLHVVRRIEREGAAASEHEEARIFRLSMVNRKGDRVVANIAISPVGGEGGDGAHVVTFDDVTERVSMEEQLLRHERLASLGLLAAGVAHEINTPLTGISSYAQLLIEETGEGHASREILQKIEDQTRRASRITSSLLNLARPEQTALEALDLNDTIREVLQLFEPQIKGRRIELEVDLAETLPSIRGHRGKLQQVLLNLLINARDAVDAGGRIRLSSELDAGMAIVEVEDNGLGIAEEDLPSIFDPFFTTKGRGRGTGLGLSISYGIVQELGGEIQVESRQDEFTRFRVLLPVTRSAQAFA
jgi:PAS domain S-box-containing protein